MKKIILGLAIAAFLICCAEKSKQIDIVKADMKKNLNRITDSEIQAMKFETLEMISVDGKNNMVDISFARKKKALYGGVYAFLLDVCKYEEIKKGDKIVKVEAYRLAPDTVSKSIYFINGEKIIGRFFIK